VEFQNIVSVSWGDHLAFGQGDGKLAHPDAVKRCMDRWREDLNASTIHWRLFRKHIKGRFQAASGYRHPSQAQIVDWNDLELVPFLARETGLKSYLYVSLFDEGWPLPPKKVRQVSYHNDMHGQHVAWQTDFSRLHPEFVLVDRIGKHRQWGVLCQAYPEVRMHFRQRFLNLLSKHSFDGLFVCLRSQSRPADYADQYGFNEPVRTDYQKRYSRDICTQDFDLQAWRDLCGEYITIFLKELRHELKHLGVKLAVGAARGDVLGPPLGNTTLNWPAWVEQDLIDELVINQNSSQCPSMWHQLWPMHRGYGYLQNYIDDYNLPLLQDHLQTTYAPVFAKGTVKLYIALQWDERSMQVEKSLLEQSPVSGLVFSSFRNDNIDTVARGDWRV
jgi:hypothetical protein